MMEDVKVGDIVSLRTGGPEMVVTSVIRTPNDTVLIGCAPLETGADEPIEVSIEQIISMH